MKTSIVLFEEEGAAQKHIYNNIDFRSKAYLCISEQTSSSSCLTDNARYIDEPTSK